MRIALVTEQFAPSTEPAAHVTREVLSRLIERGHDVMVFAAGRGQAKLRRRPPVLGEPDDPGLRHP